MLSVVSVGRSYRRGTLYRVIKGVAFEWTNVKLPHSLNIVIVVTAPLSDSQMSDIIVQN